MEEETRHFEILASRAAESKEALKDAVFQGPRREGGGFVCIEYKTSEGADAEPGVRKYSLRCSGDKGAYVKRCAAGQFVEDIVS